jgi:VanZ family protein
VSEPQWSGTPGVTWSEWVVEAPLHWWSLRPGWLRALAPIALMVLLWWSSSRPARPGVPAVTLTLLHNSAHVIAYAALAAAVWLWGWCRQPSRSRWAAALAFAVACAYGIVDELHQFHVPGRTATVWDWVSDCCGALLACLWLRWRLAGESGRPTAILLLLLASLVSVAMATWWPA